MQKIKPEKYKKISPSQIFFTEKKIQKDSVDFDAEK